MLFTLVDYYIIVTLERECNDTDIRLVDGQTPADGIVEICLGGVWGSVCSNGWDGSDAIVVCQQLGYDGCKYYLLYWFSNTCNLFLLSQHLIHYCTVIFQVYHQFSIWTMLTAVAMRTY